LPNPGPLGGTECLARTLARMRGHRSPFLTTRDHVADRARDTRRTRDPLGIARSLAEEEGFEPTVPLRVRRFSKPVP
jgi:hypothetical protein